MNSIHDMGGMHGFGAVRPEEDAVFHAPWESRLFAMLLSMAPHRPLDPGGMRAALESLPPAQYLSLGYYERILMVLERALVGKGMVSTEELSSRRRFLLANPDTQVLQRKDPELAKKILDRIHRTQPPHRESGVPPRFGVGDTVRVRNIHPKRHTRLPRYVRGKTGIIERLHDLHDADEGVLAGGPQAVYSVRFDCRELWGESAEPHESLNVDMWESYLAPA